MAIKHVGRLKSNQRRVVVAYRTVPGDPLSAVVVPTEILASEEHDALMRCVEGAAGQEAYEFAEAMARFTLPDGRNMLAGFHTTGKMVKVATSEVEMIPDTKTKVSLDELNRIIAEQKGVSLEDLALAEGSTKPSNSTEKTEPNLEVIDDIVQPSVQETPDVLSDEDLAAKYRSDADRLFKEAKKLREQAEELAPSKKKTSNKESV